MSTGIRSARRREIRVLVSVCAVTTAGALGVFLLGGLAVQIRDDLGLSRAAIGQGVFVYFVVSAIGSFRLGHLAERIGHARVMRIAALVAVVGLLVMSASRSFAALIAGLALCGVANAAGQPAANALVVLGIRPSRRGFALGVKQAAIPIATLLAGLMVPLVALTVGWEWAFAGGALLCALAAWSVPADVRHPPEETDDVGLAPPGRRVSFGLSARPLVVLGLAAAFGAAQANALGAFTTSSAVDTGLSAAAAGWLLASSSVAGLIVRIVAGWRADRRGRGHLAVVAAALLGGSVGLVLMAFGGVELFVLGTLMAFAMGWGWPGVFNLAIVSHYVRAPAAATGLTQTGTYLGGAMGPLVMGEVIDGAGFTAAWNMFAVVGVCAAASMIVGRRMIRRAVADAAVAQPSAANPPIAPR